LISQPSFFNILTTSLPVMAKEYTIFGVLSRII
jgi:hypothetical protein